MSKFLWMLVAVCLGSSPAFAKKPFFAEEIGRVAERITQKSSTTVPAVGTIEVAFSPNEGAEALVLKVIDSSQQSIRMLAYSFTSKNVTDALLRAKRRNVDVTLAVDYKNNFKEGSSDKAKAALNALVLAGVRVRVVKVFPIHHDKAVVSDMKHVEQGSFNFSAAATRNSEGAQVNWNNPALAEIYLKHWERNWALGVDYQPEY